MTPLIKPMWIAMLLVVINMLGMRGSKITVSLMSLELGASQFMVGVIVALYSLLPMFLGLYAGKLTDRLGVRLGLGHHRRAGARLLHNFRHRLPRKTDGRRRSDLEQRGIFLLQIGRAHV